MLAYRSRVSPLQPLRTEHRPDPRPNAKVSRLWHALWTKATRCELGIHVVLLSVRCLDCLSYCRVQYPLRPFSFSWSFGSSLQSLSPIDAVIWWRPFEDVARGRNGPQGPDESVRPGAKRGTMNSKRIHIDSLNPSGLLSFLGAPIDIYIFLIYIYDIYVCIPTTFQKRVCHGLDHNPQAGSIVPYFSAARCTGLPTQQTS